MAKNRSEKSCYRSGYGGGWQTAAAFLTETACERLAAHDGVRLGHRFWMNEPWKSVYRREMAFARRLLAAYSDAAVVKAWTTPPGNRVRTLSAPWFRDVVTKAQATMDSVQTRLLESHRPEAVDTTEKPRPGTRTARRSIRERLEVGEDAEQEQDHDQG